MRPKLAYVVTEDWFFCSHFLPMARAAKAHGFDVSVICRVRDHGQAIVDEGFRLLPLEADRRSLNPFRLLAGIAALRRTLRAEQPALVHLIALRSILLGGLAARSLGMDRMVVAVTGLGFLGAARGPVADGARGLVGAVIRMLAKSQRTRFLFENRSDPAALGLAGDDPRVTIVGGAGVDPARYPVQPMPALPPLRAAFVGRMLWSKGVDVAVAAVMEARRRGTAVTLDLYGQPDPQNPKAVPEATLRTWAEADGITWHGPVRPSDVPGLWARTHVALLPSRGGEGLPRALLEAAASGRVIITTTVPGCADFVADGAYGITHAVDDSGRMAGELVALATDPFRLYALGQAARQRVDEGYTERQVSETVAALYGQMIDGP